jgi:hypothetical protein
MSRLAEMERALQPTAIHAMQLTASQCMSRSAVVWLSPWIAPEIERSESGRQRNLKEKNAAEQRAARAR